MLDSQNRTWSAAADSRKGARSAGPSWRALYALLLGVLIALPLIAQNNGAAAPAGNNAQRRVSLPQDWSHRHLIFSQPASAQAAVNVQRDPRFWQQWFKHNMKPSSFGNAPFPEPLAAPNGNAGKHKPPTKPQGDWSVSLGGAAAARVAPGMYPAKFSFDINALPSCTDDYALFGVNRTGSGTQPSMVGFNNLYTGPAVSATATGTFTGTAATGTITITNGANALVMTAATGTSSTAAGTFFDGTPVGTITIQVGSGTPVVFQPGATNTCTSSTAGTWIAVATAAGNATALNTTIGSTSCQTTTPVGFTSARSTATLTITSGTPGVGGTLTVSETATFFTWSAYGTFTAGTPVGTITIQVGNGTPVVFQPGANNTCTSATAGTWVASAVAVTNATNLQATIASASCQTTFPVGFTSARTTATLRITSGTGGPAGTLTVGGTATYFTWANSLAGTGAGNYCTSSTTGGYTTAANATTNATNFTTAINLCPAAIGVSATRAAGVVTVTALTSGSAGNSITLAETPTNFSWKTPTLTGGVDAGFCSATGDASVVWAYDTHTGTGGAVTTSPVLSLDGTKVAYVESRAAGSVLHVLRMKRASVGGSPSAEGSVASPATPATVITTGTCPADATSCDFRLTYNATTNSISSPFYDYSSDSLYVGSDNGTLWKIVNVFNGTPALATGNWASGLSNGAGTSLTGPVFDFTTKNIYAGDSSGGMNYWLDTGSTTGTCGAGSAPCFGSRVTTSFTSMAAAPIVDSGNGQIMFFGKDATSPRVVQVSTALVVGNTATAGSSVTTAQIYAGAFNDAYFGVGTGTLYVCGDGATAVPTLWGIAFNAGAMTNGTPTNSLALGTTVNAACSPLTEIYNSGQGKDWLFVGISASTTLGCVSSGCVEAFDITSAFPTTTSNAAASAGGTSGIVVDNVSSSARASSLYYSTLSAAACNSGGSAGGCAVQRTQRELH